MSRIGTEAARTGTLRPDEGIQIVVLAAILVLGCVEVAALGWATVANLGWPFIS